MKASSLSDDKTAAGFSLSESASEMISEIDKYRKQHYY